MVSCNLDELAERIDVHRCKPGINETVECFAWDGNVINEGKIEYALVVHVLLVAFDAILMECLSHYPSVIRTVCQPRDEQERIGQLIRCFALRPETVVILLDAYEPLLTLLEGRTTLQPRFIVRGKEITNAIWMRSGAIAPMDDEATKTIVEALRPFVHAAFGCRINEDCCVLVLYYRSNRTAASDMGPLADETFRNRIASAFDVVLGDFNAVAEDAQRVVAALGTAMRHPMGVGIGTVKWRTPFQPQLHKCGEVSAMTVNVLVKGGTSPTQRFLLNGTPVTGDGPLLVPCDGHFSDHYGAAIDQFLVLNCAAAQSNALEFMTEGLAQANQRMWDLLRHECGHTSV